jgi:hypothetical protein
MTWRIPGAISIKHRKVAGVGAGLFPYLLTARHMTGVSVNDLPYLLNNYFGNGSHGAVTISADTNESISADAGPVIKHYTSLTIDATKTLTTTNRCKGLLIYVAGDCAINGILSMTARGSSGDPGADSNLFRAVFREKSSGTASSLFIDGTDGETVANAPSGRDRKEYKSAEVGGVGGAGGSCGVGGPGISGVATESCGGGGGGAGHNQDACSQGGAGTAGTAFSGGSGGGGGGYSSGGGGPTGGTAATFGGAGGTPGPSGGAGAGNPSGGTGGCIILIVKGALTMGDDGKIASEGTVGFAGLAGGGGSGGGRIIILHKGPFTIGEGTICVDGGAGAAGSSGGSPNGYSSAGAGGVGAITIARIE